jgi:DeoR family transcriptional regulator, deoxyribose operon repressor
MSKKRNRLREIFNILHKNGEISVKNLADHLLTSTVTIRRDLDVLEEEGIIRRVHGGAILANSYTINDRNQYLFGTEINKNIQQKSIVGLKACSLISPGETISFDIGTTVPLIAKYLPRDISISAVCLTFECALELYNKKNVNLIIPVGHLHRDSDVITSDAGVEMLKKMRTDKAFISAGGIDQALGVTCYHDYHVLLKEILMKSTKKKILVADSSKFGNVKPSHFADLEDMDAVVTDEHIPDTYRKFIEEIGIELIIARSE